MRRVILWASFVVWMGAQAQAADPCADEDLKYAGVRDGTLYFKWTGEIANEMDAQFLASFEENKDRAQAGILACPSVPHQRFAKPTELGLPLSLPVTSAGTMLKCSSCGWKQVLAYPQSDRDARKGRMR